MNKIMEVNVFEGFFYFLFFGNVTQLHLSLMAQSLKIKLGHKRTL